MNRQAQPKNLAIYNELRPRKSRSKSGCLPCRGKRKKCSGERPICTGCRRTHQTCIWPQPTISSSATTTSAISSQGSPVDRQGGGQIHTTNPPRSVFGGNIEEQELFLHFCKHTVGWMLFSNKHDWIIYQHVLPLATSDKLLMHALLAMSGVHMRLLHPEKELNALDHYNEALRGLKDRLAQANIDAPIMDHKILFVTMILLCHCEFIDGNNHGGALQHVRACQALVQATSRDLDGADRDLAVFVLETHGYFALMAILCGEEGLDLEEMTDHFCQKTLPLIRGYSSFGSMLAYDPVAITHIPRLLQLVRECRAALFIDHLQAELLDHRNKIATSGGTPLVNNDARNKSFTEEEEAIISFKAAVLSLHADSLSGPLRGQSSLHAHVENALRFLPEFQEATGSSYGLLTYLLVFGSYLQDPAQRQLLLSYTRSFTSGMPLQQRGIDLLEWLWNDAPSAGLGVDALRATARRHGVSAYLC